MSTSQDAEQPTNEVTFHKYGDFPPEARQMILKRSTKPRIIIVFANDLDLSQTWARQYRNGEKISMLPPLLDTNREARGVGKIIYDEIPDLQISHKIYFSFELDTLYFRDFFGFRAFSNGYDPYTPEPMLRFEKELRRLMVSGLVIRNSRIQAANWGVAVQEPGVDMNIILYLGRFAELEEPYIGTGFPGINGDNRGREGVYRVDWKRLNHRDRYKALFTFKHRWEEKHKNMKGGLKVTFMTEDELKRTGGLPVEVESP